MAHRRLDARDRAMERVTIFDAAVRQREPQPRIELVRKDTGGRLTLDAAALIAQYRLASGDVLLILDEDCPFEEQLHLVLVRGDGVIDHLIIGAPYTNGLYREQYLGDGALGFSFSGNIIFTLRSLEDGADATKNLPRGVRRHGGWFMRRWLSLTVEEDRRHDSPAHKITLVLWIVSCSTKLKQKES